MSILSRVIGTRKIFIVSLLWTLSASLPAQDVQGNYSVMGLGNNSCSAYVHEHAAHAAYYLSWLAGYMTAYNYTQEDTYSIFSETKNVMQIETWLLDYCKFNGEETFEQATKSLIRNMKYFRIRSKE